MQEKAARSELLIKILFFTLFIALLIIQNTQHISDRMFWLDEVTTFKIAILPFWEIPYAAAIKSGHLQPPLFYWLGHIAAYIGDTPTILRSVSVACYILLLWFVIFRMHELQIASRLTLCFVLLFTQFASYATTDFRPYALAAFSILLSSVFLYRLLQHPSSWSQALLYGLSALILQYSLTLNCFVFGVQMFFIFVYIITSFFKTKTRKSLPKNSSIITVAILLCTQYGLFLYYLVSSNNRYQIKGSFASYVEHVISNSRVLYESISTHSWVTYIVFCFFALGCFYGLKKNFRISLYLLLVFAGQLLFSTYMTYVAIPWFNQKYLVGSYVAFALICVLGAEALFRQLLFRQLGKKISVVIVILLLVIPIIFSTVKAARRYYRPQFNASTFVIEKTRCDDRKTLVLSDPAYFNKVPWYAYRNDPDIIAPYHINIETISNGFSERYCIVLQEQRQHSAYNGAYFNKLSDLPGYSKKQYATRPGQHVPASGWLFTPN